MSPKKRWNTGERKQEKGDGGKVQDDKTNNDKIRENE